MSGHTLLFKVFSGYGYGKCFRRAAVVIGAMALSLVTGALAQADNLPADQPATALETAPENPAAPLCLEQSGLCEFNPLEKQCLEEKEAITLAAYDAVSRELEASEAAASETAAVAEKKTAPAIISPPAPKKTVVKKTAVIDAPPPNMYKMENGKKVCKSKSDKPQKSEKGKGIHMDMECCLDPDEIPNPHCYYDPQKYGKYLKKFQ